MARRFCWVLQVQKWLNFTTGGRSGTPGVMSARFYEALVLGEGALGCFGWHMGNCTHRAGSADVVSRGMAEFEPWDAVDCWWVHPSQYCDTLFLFLWLVFFCTDFGACSPAPCAN